MNRATEKALFDAVTILADAAHASILSPTYRRRLDQKMDALANAIQAEIDTVAASPVAPTRRILSIAIDFEIPLEVSLDHAKQYLGERVPHLLNNLQGAAGNRLCYFAMTTKDI